MMHIHLKVSISSGCRDCSINIGSHPSQNLQRLPNLNNNYAETPANLLNENYVRGAKMTTTSPNFNPTQLERLFREEVANSKDRTVAITADSEAQIVATEQESYHRLNLASEEHKSKESLLKAESEARIEPIEEESQERKLIMEEEARLRMNLVRKESDMMRVEGAGKRELRRGSAEE